MDENETVIGNLVLEGRLSLKLPLLSVNVPMVFPFKETETEPRASPPAELFTLPETITFCALTIAGSINKNNAT